MKKEKTFYIPKPLGVPVVETTKHSNGEVSGWVLKYIKDVDQPLEPILPPWHDYKPCLHPSHNFPTMLYIPPGKLYTHVCPGCGFRTTCRGSGAIC